MKITTIEFSQILGRFESQSKEPSQSGKEIIDSLVTLALITDRQYKLGTHVVINKIFILWQNNVIEPLRKKQIENINPTDQFKLNSDWQNLNDLEKKKKLTLCQQQYDSVMKAVSNLNALL